MEYAWWNDVLHYIIIGGNTHAKGRVVFTEILFNEANIRSRWDRTEDHYNTLL